MPIKMNKPSESAFGINIEDRFDENDDHTVELIEMSDFQGISKLDGKPFTSVKWVMRIFDEDGVSFTNLIDGGPYELWAFSSMSLATKSNARAWASAFIGHELSDEECDELAEDFDEALVGKRARASWKVEEDPTTKNRRLKIALLRPLKPSRRSAATQAPLPETAPPTPTPAAAPAATVGETAAQRRARLQAELAAMSDDDDQEAPF